MQKEIQFYRVSNYGTIHEYCADKGIASILQKLTRQKTITGAHRELVRDLCGSIGLPVPTWKEIPAP